MRSLLFDIDGTLLLTNGGGSGALKLAIEREFGVETACADVNFSGRTDRSLLSEILHRNDLPTNDEHHERLRDRYAAMLPQVLASRGGCVLPGAVDLLKRLSRDSGLRTYVMTGNLHQTATQKLDHFGLLHFFDDVYGGDHDHERDRLAERTAAAIRDRDGEAATSDMIVIGDTPADIRCGHTIGAKVVAVCTGNHERAELEAENPMSVHDDMSNVSAIFDLLAA